MKDKCVYPGSFDPLTLGHLDIIKRASRLFSEVHVAVLNNTSKKYMFSLDDRLDIISKETKQFGNVYAHIFNGLLVDFLKKMEINVVVRGIRNVADMEIEMQMANTNKILKPDLETVLLVSNPKLNHISSSIIKELITLHADVGSFVPKTVTQIINRGK
jgi:pantetheine-phosphate adenylyltransferase